MGKVVCEVSALCRWQIYAIIAWKPSRTVERIGDLRVPGHFDSAVLAFKGNRAFARCHEECREGHANQQFTAKEKAKEEMNTADVLQRW